MKRKSFSAVLGVIVALATLVAIAVPLATAADPITFLNPLGDIEPLNNQPLAERPATLNGKTVLPLFYGAATNNNGRNALIALGDMLKVIYPDSVISAPVAITPAYDAKSDTQYNVWAAAADAVIIGVADENIGAWWSSYHARQLEARGVPVVVVANSSHLSAVTNGAKFNGIAALRTAVIDHMWYARAFGLDGGANDAARVTYMKNNVLDKANLDPVLPDKGSVFSQTANALTASLTVAEISSAPLDKSDFGYAGDDAITVTGTSRADAIQKFQEMSMNMNFGDGLPLVIPTGNLVADMLSATDRGGSEIIGKMIGGGIITVEKVAINAVMAGARPEHFPVILAAMEAYASDWDNGTMFYRATSESSNMSLMLLISGPIAEELGIASDRGYGDSGFEANSVIGRAVRLCIRNIGRRLTEDTSVTAGLTRLNDIELLVFAEQSADLPAAWKTHSEMMGFPVGSNTVSLLCISTWSAGTGEPSAMALSGALSGITTAVGTNGANGVAIVALTAGNAALAAETGAADTRMTTGNRNGNNNFGYTTKELWKERVTANIRALAWPVVVGGDPNYNRTFHGGANFGVRGYRTQLISKSGEETAPGAPLDAKALFNNSLTKATLSWSAPIRDGGSPITGYQISCDDGRAWADVGMIDEYTVNGLDPDAEYLFRVRAVNDVANTAEIAVTAGTLGAAGVTCGVSYEPSGRGAWADMNVDIRPPITSLKIGTVDGSAPSMFTASRNSTIQFGTIVNAGALDEGVVWTVSDQSFAVVDANGTVTVLNKMGTVVLMVTDPASGICSAIVIRIT
ncbi:MAG: fibronectin type III domain-containing protein [Oscillospiraceae bacterium]|nr:fibronectin type III domain-containing protein [Oscillospiraceae bacterium]